MGKANYKGYKISRVHICKLFNEHVPFLTAVEVTGPKGGKYMLDGFNSERLIEYIVGTYNYAKIVRAARVYRILFSSSVFYSKMTTPEGIINNDMNTRYTYLKRREGMGKTKEIADKLNSMQKGAIITYFNDNSH